MNLQMTAPTQRPDAPTGNQPLSAWIWGLLSRMEFIAGTENPVKKATAEEVLGARGKPDSW